MKLLSNNVKEEDIANLGYCEVLKGDQLIATVTLGSLLLSPGSAPSVLVERAHINDTKLEPGDPMYSNLYDLLLKGVGGFIAAQNTNKLHGLAVQATIIHPGGPYLIEKSMVVLQGCIMLSRGEEANSLLPPPALVSLAPKIGMLPEPMWPLPHCLLQALFEKNNRMVKLIRKRMNKAPSPWCRLDQQVGLQAKLMEYKKEEDVNKRWEI